jgi:hypothetical protein
VSQKEVTKKPTTQTAVKRPVGRPKKQATIAEQTNKAADKALTDLQAASHKASVKAKKAAAKRKAVKKLEASVKGKVARPDLILGYPSPEAIPKRHSDKLKALEDKLTAKIAEALNEALEAKLEVRALRKRVKPLINNHHDELISDVITGLRTRRRTWPWSPKKEDL